MRMDYVIRSAGRDILSDDPVHNMVLVPADISLLTGLVLDALHRSLALFLEGGYGPPRYTRLKIFFCAQRRALTEGKP
jgi:acetoin utilization deacetylase AcuC-like enzyme